MIIVLGKGGGGGEVKGPIVVENRRVLGGLWCDVEDDWAGFD